MKAELAEKGVHFPSEYQRNSGKDEEADITDEEIPDEGDAQAN